MARRRIRVRQAGGADMKLAEEEASNKMTTPKITPEYLTGLRKLSDAATPGPWKNNNRGIDAPVEYPEATYYDTLVRDILWKHDADFMAASRTAIPALLDHIEKLEAMMPHAPSTCVHYQPDSGNESCRMGGPCWTRHELCDNGKWQLK